MRLSPQRIPILVALSVLSLATVAPAGADPIQLIGGSIVYSRGSVATFAATGADGTLVGSDFGNFVSEVWNPDHACVDCVPGSTIGLSQSESLTSGGDVGAGGSIRVGELEYWIDSLIFTITAGTFTLPDSSNGAIRLSSPFTLEGVISGRTLAGEARTFSLFGTGTATAFFGGNDWGGTTYEFAAATPEPGTLLLLGGPAAFALLRRRRTSREAGPAGH